MGMTKNREHKARIQSVRQSTEPVRAASPRQISKFGRFLPLSMGQAFAASCERGNGTHGRTREMVREERAAARRTAGRRRVF